MQQVIASPMLYAATVQMKLSGFRCMDTYTFLVDVTMKVCHVCEKLIVNNNMLLA